MDGGEAKGTYGGGLVKRRIEDTPPVVRRFFALSVAWKASNIVMMLDKCMISLICLRKPLLYCPTMMYSGSLVSARILEYGIHQNNLPQRGYLE